MRSGVRKEGIECALCLCCTRSQWQYIKWFYDEVVKHEVALNGVAAPNPAEAELVKGVKKTLAFIMGRARTNVPKALTPEVVCLSAGAVDVQSADQMTAFFQMGKNLLHGWRAIDDWWSNWNDWLLKLDKTGVVGMLAKRLLTKMHRLGDKHQDMPLKCCSDCNGKLVLTADGVMDGKRLCMVHVGLAALALQCTIMGVAAPEDADWPTFCEMRAGPEVHTKTGCPPLARGMTFVRHDDAMMSLAQVDALLFPRGVLVISDAEEASGWIFRGGSLEEARNGLWQGRGVAAPKAKVARPGTAAPAKGVYFQWSADRLVGLRAVGDAQPTTKRYKGLMRKACARAAVKGEVSAISAADVKQTSSRSGRSGMCTGLHRAGVSKEFRMQQAGHADPVVADGYVQTHAPFEECPVNVGDLLLRGKMMDAATAADLAGRLETAKTQTLVEENGRLRELLGAAHAEKQLLRGAPVAAGGEGGLAARLQMVRQQHEAEPLVGAAAAAAATTTGASTEGPASADGLAATGRADLELHDSMLEAGCLEIHDLIRLLEATPGENGRGDSAQEGNRTEQSETDAERSETTSRKRKTCDPACCAAGETLNCDLSWAADSLASNVLDALLCSGKKPKPMDVLKALCRGGVHARRKRVSLQLDKAWGTKQARHNEALREQAGELVLPGVEARSDAMRLFVDARLQARCVQGLMTVRCLGEQALELVINAVAAALGVAAEQVRLMVDGERLAAQRTVSENCLSDGSKVELCLEQRGGAGYDLHSDSDSEAEAVVSTGTACVEEASVLLSVSELAEAGGSVHAVYFSDKAVQRGGWKARAPLAQPKTCQHAKRRLAAGDPASPSAHLVRRAERSAEEARCEALRLQRMLEEDGGAAPPRATWLATQAAGDGAGTMSVFVDAFVDARLEAGRVQCPLRVRCRGDEPLLQVLHAVGAALGVATEQLRLTVDGVRLASQRSLAENCLVDGSEMELFQEQRGGVYDLNSDSSGDEADEAEAEVAEVGRTREPQTRRAVEIADPYERSSRPLRNLSVCAGGLAREW